MEEKKNLKFKKQITWVALLHVYIKNKYDIYSFQLYL